tara:strand:+ start:587 stop:2002 length:1416 start_codon:yes stop_codon:yes gene_type:complete
MAGLFDYQSPENMRAARLDPLLVSGAQMGQQPLLNQLVSQMSNAGANLGAAGAGMLGLQLPEEARQQQVQSIMQGVDQNDVAGLMEASKRFSAANMSKEAGLIADRANTLKQQAMTNRLTLAETQLAEGTLAADIEAKKAAARTARAGADVAEGTKDANIELVKANVNYRTASITDLNAKTASIIFETGRSKTLLPYEINQRQIQLRLDKQALSERTDLAPLKVKELQTRIATAQSNLAEQQARAPANLVLLQNQVDVVVKDAAFRDELSKLDNPTDAEITKVVNKYGSPKVILDNVARLDSQRAAEEALAQKREEVQLKLDQKVSAATAEFYGNISLIDSSDVTLKEYIKDIEDDKVDFSRSGRLASYIKAETGNADEKTLKAAKIQREFVKQANLILQAAAGVQTDGDAKRAFDSIITNLETYSNKGVKQALTEIQTWQQTIKTKNIEMINKNGGNYRAAAVDLTQFDN